ncbi:zinc dependent phospholipase C family protein [Paenibacillus amylolyticus]|uniref:zinc dependent phospholipase C family protein n=1 Tax=Paenibacillus amylolyticus TaxID=1451 RepID=UPI0039B0C295
MPWPMVHFAIASELISKPSPELLLGSLAPDSIHVRTNLRTEKEKTHLMPEAGRFTTDEELKDFFETQKKLAYSDPKFMQYLCGYIAHIYTDRVWTFDIYPAYEVHPNGRSMYTQDVTKLEFMILRNLNRANDWLIELKVGRAFDLGGLLESEVYQYRGEKLEFLANPDNELLGDLNILSMEVTEEFIQKTALALKQLYTKWDVYKDLRSTV